MPSTPSWGRFSKPQDKKPFRSPSPKAPFYQLAISKAFAISHLKSLSELSIGKLRGIERRTHELKAPLDEHIKVAVTAQNYINASDAFGYIDAR